MIPKITNKYDKPGNRNIYNALYDTLVYIKPKRCLEIGTFYGYSAKVFQDYFNKYYQKGKLVTIDIKKYVDLSELSNVIQIIVHPHVNNSSQWHYVNDSEILEYDVSSVKKNIKIIHEITHGYKFDFCFFDGDHQFESVRRDMLIAQNELNSPKYILFDDMDIEAHDSCRYYKENIKSNKQWLTYEYKDWGDWVGAALMWENI